MKIALQNASWYRARKEMTSIKQSINDDGHRKEDLMRTTATRKQTIATPLQRIPPILVKWTSLFLVLLVMMVTTFSGRLLPITRANPSHKYSAAVIPPGCPPPASTSAEVYLNPMGDACYYYKTPGCTGAYSQSSGNYCFAEINPSSFPAAGS